MCTLPRPMTTQHLSDNEFLFTSESVTEGHPDKMADQISDGVLDAIMAEDPNGSRRLRDVRDHRARGGRRRDHDRHLRGHPEDRARDDPRHRLHAREVRLRRETCAVLTAIDEQSPDIAQGVDAAYEARTPRRRRPARQGGRGRPGHDVRLRHARDEGAHADADPDRAHARAAAGGGAQGGRGALPAARTARRRSPSATRTASRSRSRRS